MFEFIFIIIVLILILVVFLYVFIKIKQFSSSVGTLQLNNSILQESIEHVYEVMSTSIPTKTDLYNSENDVLNSLNKYKTASSTQLATSNVNVSPFNINSTGNSLNLSTSGGVGHSFDSTGTAKHQNVQVEQCVKFSGNNSICGAPTSLNVLNNIKGQGIEAATYIYSRGGNSTLNTAQLQTMFPSPVDGINHIRGDTELSGNFVVDGNLMFHNQFMLTPSNDNWLRLMDPSGSNLIGGFAAKSLQGSTIAGNALSIQGSNQAINVGIDNIMGIGNGDLTLGVNGTKQITMTSSNQVNISGSLNIGSFTLTDNNNNLSISSHGSNIATFSPNRVVINGASSNYTFM